MKLIPDWRRVVRKAWSIRLALVAAFLGGAELLLQYLTPAQPSGRFVLLGVVVNLAAAFSRIVAQPRLYVKDSDERHEP